MTSSCQGTIHVICGPMFAGKSTEITRIAKRSILGKKNVAIFKHGTDDRYDKDNITTHDNCKIKCVPVLCSKDIASMVNDNVDIVIIDEVQFFDDGIVDLCMKLADSGKEIFAVGLDLDFKRNPFPIMGKLMCLANSVMKIDAVCSDCGGHGIYSHRKKDDTGSVVDIGGADKYEPLCRKCYMNKNKNTISGQMSFDLK